MITNLHNNSFISELDYSNMHMLHNVATYARKLKTPGDLLDLINAIRFSERNSYPLTIADLYYYCNPNVNRKRYISFFIPKKSGGNREISAPVPVLRAFLTPINIILRSLYEPNPCVMGFTIGRSIVDNAKSHLGQNYVLNIDLKDFFPSIKQARIWKRLQLPPFNFTKEVANVVAGLCSYKVNYENGATEYVLPQGAPTSPILTNIICEKLDRRLFGVAKRFHLRYTRYADDITFSSMHNVLNIDGEAYKEIVRIIEEQGFVINVTKTRLQKIGSRQEVTGLILSNKVNTPRSYIRDIDQILYVWNKFGYECAFVRLLEDYGKRTYHKKGLVILEEVIAGKLNYLRMVKGRNDATYQRYATIFDDLRFRFRVAPSGNIYLATYKLEVFQSLYKTSINIYNGKNGNIKASFIYDGVNYKVALTSATRNLIVQDKSNLSSLFISLCRDNDVYFWLIHLYVPEMVSLIIPINKLIELWEKEGLSVAFETEAKYKHCTNKYQFIDAIINDPSLNVYDRKKVYYLSRDFLSSKEVTTTSRARMNKWKHSPEYVSGFLMKFSLPTNLRYAVHDWEGNYDDYETFIEDINRYKGEVSSLFNFNEVLSYVLRNYLFEKDKDINQYYWDKNKKIKIGLQYPDGVALRWMKENNNSDLWAMPLICFPEENRPRGLYDGLKELSSMRDVRNEFKHIIEFRDKDFYNLIKGCFGKKADHFVCPQLDERQLDKKLEAELKSISFYTYTKAVSDALKIVADNIRDRAINNKCKEVKLHIISTDKYWELHIVHLGSFSEKSIDEEKLYSGTIGNIWKSLLSICDYAIAGRFMGKDGKLANYQIDYLYPDVLPDDKGEPEFRIIPIDRNLDGFEFIFKFYKNVAQDINN